jgi:hypothetical protein
MSVKQKKKSHLTGAAWRYRLFPGLAVEDTGSTEMKAARVGYLKVKSARMNLQCGKNRRPWRAQRRNDLYNFEAK